MKLKEYAITSIKKNLPRRLSWLFLCIAVFLLGDEYLKEGYFFHLNEASNPLCHEFWITVSLALSILSYVIHKLKGGDERG